MKRLLRAWARLKGSFPSARRDAELADEIETHLRLQTDDNIKLGMSPREARRRAVLKLGGVESIKESYRDQRRLPGLGAFAGDVRFASRGLRKSPAFTAAAVLSLALGIAVTCAVFSLVNALMFGSMPFRDPGSLVIIRQTLKQKRGDNFRDPSVADIVDFARAAKTLSGIGFVELFVDSGVLIADRPAESVFAQGISPNLLEILGVRPALGRGFLPDDEGAVLLSHEFWKRRFNADPRILGKTVLLGDAAAAVVGVMPPHFTIATEVKVDLWSCSNPRGILTRKEHWFTPIARLAPGVTVARARAELEPIAAQLARAYPDTNKDTGASVLGLEDWVIGDSRPIMTMFLVAAGFVLLIACANVANLLLARFGARAGEITVRASLGASRGRLVRQMLTESLVLASLGGLAGYLAAAWVIRAFTLLMPGVFDVVNLTSVDARILLFTVLITALTAVLFGAAPAWRVSRFDLASYLKEASRVTLSKSGYRLRAVLVIAEISLALVLLAGTGLMIRTIRSIQAVDPGFDPNNILTVETNLQSSKYVGSIPPETNRLTPAVDLFYARLLERAARLPGVLSAAYTSDLPDTGIQVRTFTVAGRGPVPEAGRPSVGYYEVSPQYFRTLRIPVKLGRAFDDNDRAGAPWAIVVDETFARRFFPAESPIGKLVRFRYEPYKVEEEQPRVIVGVVGNVKFWRRSEQAFPIAYASTLQQPQNFPGGRCSAHLRRRLLLKTRSDVHQALAPLLAAVKTLIADEDRAVPVNRVKTLDDVIEAVESDTTYITRLLALFGTIAALLAACGIYGVMSYTVAERTNEIGIRMALGAQRSNIARMVLRKSLILALAGIGIGVLAALALTRFVAGTLLFGVQPWDPATYIAVSLTIAAVAALAGYLPARRAAKLDPLLALRHQ